MVKINNKWQPIKNTIRLRVEKEITTFTDKTKYNANCYEADYTEDIMLIQKPYELVKNIISYTDDYFNDVGEKQSIIHMYADLIDLYPNKNYILVDKHVENINSHFEQCNKQITYTWLIK
jgi:hypothetical protein